ncbi:hypothetical protein JW968_03385 [Candidatus Woesearchaeota archaeon]|nr:hypothetical protein [Candidatus Woesearchaeota archaeon]
MASGIAYRKSGQGHRDIWPGSRPAEAAAVMAVIRDGVVHISPRLQAYLNSCDSVDQFPEFLATATLNHNLEFIVRPETGRATIATARIGEGEVISYATGSKISRPLRYSRQIDDSVHVVGRGAIDHSCSDPTCIVDPDTDNLVARRAILPGEIISFNYLTTEMDMASPFVCRCRQDRCNGIIGGFRYLNDVQRAQLAQRFPTAAYLQKYISQNR